VTAIERKVDHYSYLRKCITVAQFEYDQPTHKMYETVAAGYGRTNTTAVYDGARRSAKPFHCGDRQAREAASGRFERTIWLAA
jgi:hypothetical protein